MLVNNYYKVFEKIRKNDASTSVIGTNGNSYNALYKTTAALDSLSPLYLLQNNTISTSAGYAIWFGTNNAPETGESTSQKGTVVSTITTSASYSWKTNADGTRTGTREITVTNSSTTDSITIGEVCLGGAVRVSSSSIWPFLVDRTPLETPLVLEPKGVGKIFYSITVS